MRLPNPYTLEETLGKLRHRLATACNEEALALLRGSTIEIRECLSCFGDYFERSRDALPYYLHHDAVNGIDCALYAMLFAAAHPEAAQTHE